MEITDFPCVGVILFTDCFAFVFCFVFLYKDNSLSLNSSLPSKEEWIRAQKPVWISGTFNWDYGLAFGNIYKHEFKNNIPQCCFDHICDSKKKKKKFQWAYIWQHSRRKGRKAVQSICSLYPNVFGCRYSQPLSFTTGGKPQIIHSN